MPRVKIENISATKSKERFAKSKAAIEPQKTSVNSTYKLLKSKKLIASTKPSSEQDVSLEILASLNVSLVVDRDITYSFKKERQNQILKNKNIVDKNLNKLQNELVSPQNRFVNKDDPFYEMDSAPSIHEQDHIDYSRNIEKPNTSQVVQDIFTQNMLLGNSVVKLKQFK